MGACGAGELCRKYVVRKFFRIRAVGHAADGPATEVDASLHVASDPDVAVVTDGNARSDVFVRGPERVGPHQVTIRIEFHDINVRGLAVTADVAAAEVHQ